MMLTPWGPRAIPTGGAGVACPACGVTLTTAATFFLAGMLGPSFGGDDTGRCRQCESECDEHPDADAPAKSKQLGRWGQNQVQIFSIWLNSRSTGVERPRISTRALMRWLFVLISVIWAGTPAKGPSVICTDSPTS